MTREEAIKTIESAKHFAYDDVYTKAFDKAIKALKQEPCENAIRRTAVVDLIKSLPNANSSYWNKCDLLLMAGLIDDIEQLPSVSTEKTGRWHKKYDSIVNDYFWECDTCKCGFQRDYPHCPNCGAKMEGVK